jgi:hypothetical protein
MDTPMENNTNYLVFQCKCGDVKVDRVHRESEMYKSLGLGKSERMYSEEDMNEYADYCLMCSAEKTLKIPLQPKEWFEQFKKK